MGGPVELFDRRAVRRHRARAAARIGAHDFLFREVAGRLAERLGDMRRGFDLALAFGGQGGALAAALDGHPRIGRLVQADPSPALLAGARGFRVAADEARPPFADARLDLIASLLGLHWVDDLPGALVQMRRALKPDGLLLAALFGAGTLAELRESLATAEGAAEGGVGPRVSPFADVRDAGHLLQRAGFALPMVDADTITVTYPDAFALMRELRGMGEANALRERRKTFTRRATMMAAAEVYTERFGDAEGRIPATFQVLWLTAWAPDASQRKPLAPGSAKSRLADALDATECPAGEKAKP